jgi:hypothetical protein
MTIVRLTCSRRPPMTNEIEDLKRDSARLTWLVEEAHAGRHHLARAGVDQHSVRAYVDHHMAPANADAERARWCEQMKAQVHWEGHIEKWAVYYHSGMVTHLYRDPDRNTAIDKARGVK